MSGSEKAPAPLDETIEACEPGSLLIETGALQPEADDAEPRVVHVREPTEQTVGETKPVVDEAKVVAEMALTVPETDPERLAYAMWNEGRADEAIELLERHLAAEHARRRETALVPSDGKDAIRVEPASDWRERHRAAHGSADFNAFGNSVHTIDVTPTQADAVVPHSARSPLRIGWLMGVCLAALCVSAAGAYFVMREGSIERALTASEHLITELTSATETPATTPPAEETEIVATATDVDTDVSPSDEAEAADASPPADEEIVPPEEDIPADDAASVPPEEDVPVDDVASVPPKEDAVDEATPTVSDEAFRTLVTIPQERNASRDDVASAPPVDASLLPPAADASTVDTAAEVPASDAVPPEETASIETETSATDDQPIVEARLPRARPEPPASVVARASEPQVIALEEEPAIPDSELPLVVSEPPLTEAELPVASVDSDVPVYGPDGPIRIYRHIRRIYPPVIGRTFPRRMLTPAEYRALLERRQLAERYTAERRQGIIGRVITLP